MLVWLAIVTLALGVQAQSDVELEITSQGYKAESYNVTTSDGYVLKVHRLYRNNTRKVAFLMHAFGLTSKSFIYPGPKKALAYNLADAGYDVWMGNARGNKYSRRHVSMNPDQKDSQYFRYTYEEIGIFDTHDMIDYVLNTTKRSKLHYIGHNLGGTAFYVLNSMIPAFQSKFSSAHLLAGLGYETNFPQRRIRSLCKATDVIYSALEDAGYLEMKPVDFTKVFLNIFMNDTVPFEIIGGTSVMVMTQYCQNIRDKSFARWNYGEAGNLKQYGTKSPPTYDLSKIKVNVTLYYSVDDATQSEADVLAMSKALVNAKVRQVSGHPFSNLDYLNENFDQGSVSSAIIENIDSTDDDES